MSSLTDKIIVYRILFFFLIGIMSENIVEGQLHHLKGLFVVIEKFQDVKFSFFFLIFHRI